MPATSIPRIGAMFTLGAFAAFFFLLGMGVMLGLISWGQL